MVWGAWYTGVKWHSPFSAAWLKAVLGAPIPMWMFLASFLSLVVIFPRWARTFHKKPVVHMTVSPNTRCWALRQEGGEAVMRIMCDVKFAVSNSTRTVTLVSAYLEKTKPYYHLHEPIRVPPLLTNAHISVPVYPVLAKKGEGLRGRLCFADIQGNVYKTEVLTFKSVE
jgi:hypothetical protein